MERFMMLYENVYKDLYRLAYYYLGNPHDAEDVVGETVLKAYENFGELRNEDAFRGWIFKILINQCNTKLCKKITGKTSELTETVPYYPILEENENTSYLVLVAVDLRNPTTFTDTTGIVAGSNLYYVSGKNIYVADTKTVTVEEENNFDKTALLRFSYEKGKFALRATGEIKGILNNSFSLDEYNNYLRTVTTVREYEFVEVKDDRTGEILGSYIENERQTNSLYVLDENLKVAGQIEGLAEDEQIYSARFMGDTGYFVTFRQTDPLFAVDLSEPENPKVLSELKVSGFSEYLHDYGEGRLFGLGMEADEETGMQEGMKLSMFDISDPANVQEISRHPLEKNNYSEALYNYHALMISPEKNIIGFEAEGSNRGEYWKEYVIYTYEEDQFVQKLRIDTKAEDGSYYLARGTFIGDVFYLLRGDGSIQSYDVISGKALENLKP